MAGDVPQCVVCGQYMHTMFHNCPGPMVTQPLLPTAPYGCICPPGANKDCEAPMCPRRGLSVKTNT